MPREKTTTTIALVNARTAESQAKQIVTITKDIFEGHEFWGRLSPEQRDKVVLHSNEVSKGLVAHTASGMYIGEHLSKVKAILPYGALGEYLAMLPWSRRTLYRYIDMYEKAGQHYSQPLILQAQARRINLPGRYEEAIEKMSPPTNLTAEEADEWLDKMVAKQREIDRKRKEGIIPARSAAAKKRTEEEDARRDPEFLKEHCFRTVRNALGHLGTTARKRRFLESLVGMLMIEAGMQSAQTFAPEAAPDDYRRGPGRPSKASEEGLQLVRTA